MALQNEPGEFDIVTWLATGHKQNARAIEEIRKHTFKGPWIKAVPENGWTFAGGTYEDVYYRYYGFEALEFKGHWMTTGASDTVAFTIIEPFWLPFDKSMINDVVTGTGFSTCRYFISSVDGTVTITYPADA